VIYLLRLLRLRLSLISIFLMPLCMSNACAETSLPVVTETAERDQRTAKYVISGEDIRADYQSLDAFLRQLTGMQVQHSGGLGDPVLLSVRGATAQQTTFLINGVRVNDAQGGSYDLSQIPVELIERVEISDSGSNGGMYDSAIGGTINIVTRHTGYLNRAAASVGNYGYRSLALTAAPHPDVLLYAGTEYSDNNFDYPVPAPWNGNSRYSEEPLNNASFFRHSAQLAITRNDIVSKLGWTKQGKDIPDYFRNSPENRARFDRREFRFNTGTQLDTTQPDSTRQEFSLQWAADLSSKYETYQDPESTIGLGEDNNRYRLHHAGLSFSPQWQKEKLTLGASLAAEADRYQSTYLNDPDSRDCTTPLGGCDQTATQHQLNASTQADYRLNSHWDIRTSLYHRRYTTSNQATHSDNTARSEEQSDFNGFSAAVTRVSERTELQLSTRKSIRVPSLYERYGDRGLMLGNDDLAAETAQTSSIDVHIFDHEYDASLAVFQRETRDTIVPVYDSRGVGRYINVSDSTLQGIEADISYQLHIRSLALEPSLSAANYSSRMISSVRAFDGKKLPGIYHTRYLAGISAFYDMHSMNLEYELAGDLYLDSGNNNSGDIRRMLNLHYRYSALRWSAGLRINNLMDHQFRDFSNRPVAGRQIYLNANFEF